MAQLRSSHEAYQHWALLLSRLHDLAVAGDLEGDDADAIVEAMDDAWRGLNDVDQARAHRAAGALNERDGLCPPQTLVPRGSSQAE